MAPSDLDQPGPTPDQLAFTILHNLQYQHGWASLGVQAISPLTQHPLSRPVIYGLPPRPLYIHPDRQIEILKLEHAAAHSFEQHAEPEWVLPTHITESWSLARFADVFDALTILPSLPFEGDAVDAKWAGKRRQKRVLLATLHDDSTVVYYVMHDGIVKPRQN